MGDTTVEDTQAGAGVASADPNVEAPPTVEDSVAAAAEVAAVAPAEGTVVSVATNGAADATEKTTAEIAEDIDSRHGSLKRKHSPSGERDWRERRDEDRRHDRDRRGGGHRGRGAPRGGRGSKHSRENIRTSYENLPESSDPDEIRKQVEFYFSDSNLPTDKFLLSKVGGSANNPVPISVVHSFKRMRRYQPYSAIVAALRDSTLLDITGASGAEEIMRKDPLPASLTENAEDNISAFNDKTLPRTLYVKGFGYEEPTTQFDIEAFFAPYGPTNAIRLRRNNLDKWFKGSVFVEFDSEDTARQFMQLESKPMWKESPLKVMWKADYLTEKKEQEEQRRKDGKPPRERGGGNFRGRGDRGRGRGGGRGGRGEPRARAEDTITTAEPGRQSDDAADKLHAAAAETAAETAEAAIEAGVDHVGEADASLAANAAETAEAAAEAELDHPTPVSDGKKREAEEGAEATEERATKKARMDDET